MCESYSAEVSPDNAKNACVTRKKEKRTCHVSLRVTWKERKRWRGVAKQHNLSMSELIRLIMSKCVGDGHEKGSD